MEVSTSLYIRLLTLTSQMSTAHGQKARPCGWLINVHSRLLLFIPFVVYRRKRRSKAVKPSWVCRAGEGVALDVTLAWLCCSGAAGSPASYPHSPSLSALTCNIRNWSFRGFSLSESLLYSSLQLEQLCREARIIENAVFTNELITYKTRPHSRALLAQQGLHLRLGFLSQKCLCGCLYLGSPESRTCNQELGAGRIRDGERETGRAGHTRKGEILNYVSLWTTKKGRYWTGCPCGWLKREDIELRVPVGD